LCEEVPPDDGGRERHGQAEHGLDSASPRKTAFGEKEPERAPDDRHDERRLEGGMQGDR
jgi:hypothetical protein